MVKSRLRGGERVSSFGTETTLFTEACETRRFAKEVVSSSS